MKITKQRNLGKGDSKILYAKIRKKLGNFNLDIEFEAKDETLALLGASGCGKSMTLKCIAGVEKPDEGQIILNGRTLYDSNKKINLAPQERNVGLLFQNYALFPNMTCEQNIAIGVPKNSKNQSEIVKEKIDAFNLNGLEKKYPGQLSGGQQQRIALARMLVSKPELLLLDEPFSALDTYLRWQMEQELIDVIKEHNGTILYVSHNRDEVYRICDRIAVVNNGFIETLDDKQNLFINPKTINSTVLTGCKNISKAKKIGEKRILAIDWNLELECSEQIKDDIQYVGIRSHHIGLCSEKICENSFHLNVSTIIDDLFSDIFVLTNPNNSNIPIYMTLAKNSSKDISKNQSLYITFNKKNLILLYS